MVSQPCTETGCSLLVTWSASVAPYPLIYQLERAPGYGVPFEYVTTTDQTSYLDNTLSPTSYYIYRVSASGYDVGDYSNVAEASTTPEVTAQSGFATTAGIVTLAGIGALSALYLWFRVRRNSK